MHVYRVLIDTWPPCVLIAVVEQLGNTYILGKRDSWHVPQPCSGSLGRWYSCSILHNHIPITWCMWWTWKYVESLECKLILCTELVISSFETWHQQQTEVHQRPKQDWLIAATISSTGTVVASPQPLKIADWSFHFFKQFHVERFSHASIGDNDIRFAKAYSSIPVRSCKYCCNICLCPWDDRHVKSTWVPQKKR